MQPINGLNARHLPGDIFGGLTAAVVALPLALAFGVASGAGPMAGLYGAIFVGFFAALFGGTPSQISGPTGPMTVVAATVLSTYAHDPAMAFTVIMLGGVFQILFGVLRLGSFVSYVPFTVVSGFMSGIGVIIIILQLAPMLGHPTPSGTIAAIEALPGFLAGANAEAVAIGLVSLGIVWLVPARISRILPSPLIALVSCTLLALWLGGAPVLGEIPTGLPSLQLPSFGLAALPDMIGSALVLALLGSIDSLLTSLIADNISRTEHKSDRELIGQGIGNLLAGLFGGIPGAGATMRTVVNLRAGGRTPISGAVHALVLLAVVLGLGPLASHIPHAALAGILLKVGVDIIDWSYLRKVPRAPRPGVMVMVLVLGLTVFVDLILAVAAGMVVASLLFLKRMTDLQIKAMKASGAGVDLPLAPEEAAILERNEGAILYCHFGGPITFGAAKHLVRGLVVGEGHRVMVVDLLDVMMIDTSGSLAIDEIMDKARERGMAVVVVIGRPQVRKALVGLGVLDDLPADHIYASRAAALARAEAALGAAAGAAAQRP